VETVWDEFKRRKKQTETLGKQSQESTHNLWLKFGLCFLAGIVIVKII
jgi:uncharacterized membrane protein affecting hemolysin expression